jgi:hypothetical protein
MDMFSNAIQWFYAMSSSQRAQCFSNLRAAGKLLGIGLGALKPECTTAQACWDVNVGTLNTFFGEGATLDYLIIDEPWSADFPHDEPYSVDQTAEFIRLARQTFPWVNIILQEAYPLHSAVGLSQFFTGVNAGAIARTGWGIQFAEVGHDWRNGFNLTDIEYIRDNVRSSGMKFSLIFWNSD